MASSDDKTKEIDDKIQESSKRLLGMWTPLAVHGQLLAATSEKSAILMENLTSSVDKLGLSVENLYQSSERLEKLTWKLNMLTIFLAGLTMILLLSEVFSIKDKEILIIILFIITLIALIASKKYKK
jgi:adenosyl cobinamide kinase/adenosyl cobinamide phosphate guanylyltransferase